MRKCPLLAAALLLALATADRSPAGPVTREEGQRHAQVLKQLQKALAVEASAAGKFTHIARVMKAEPAVNLRRRILALAVEMPGPEREKFLTGLLGDDKDAGVRSQAATLLGQLGSEKSLATLARVAANDPTTPVLIGDVGGQSSARRAATFAIAALAARFPKLADEAAGKLRALRIAEDGKDGQGLGDARLQALYQVTRDEALLKPFLDRLESTDARVRERGVVAFQYLALKRAPAEIARALKDPDAGVRSWSALVLGRIGDPKTGAALMAVAADGTEDALVRCNALVALGQMKTAAAAPLLEKLLADPSPAVRANAAIALYRITGKKVKQFPEGYKAD